MNEQEIKKIVCAVVDYGWPWQIEGLHAVEDVRLNRKTWETDRDQTLANLCGSIHIGEPVRLDPDHPHDWAVEMREGMPCWVRKQDGTGQFDRLWRKTGIVNSSFSTGWNVYNIVDYDWVCVALHPLHPDQPPPDDWNPEGRRILE